MIYWYSMIYNPSWFLDENGLKDGEDIMILVVIGHNIFRAMGM